jgi:serine/threonine-protein kinase HipA
MALAMNGRADAVPGVGDFTALGTALGVPERATRRALADIADRADRWLAGLERLPLDAGQVRELRRV